jgi:hypothetical protein
MTKIQTIKDHHHDSKIPAYDLIERPRIVEEEEKELKEEEDKENF